MNINGVDLPRYDKADVVAIQALVGGTASPDQQKRAFRWIIENACATYEWGYQEKPEHTALWLGRQFAGQQIVGLTKLDVSKLRSESHE